MTPETATAPKRTTEFVATLRWDEDATWDDVTGITDCVKDAGYETRVSDDNSQVLVYRTGEDGDQ